MNFVSAKIRLFRLYSLVLAITGAFMLNCALGQPVSSDKAKTATANRNIPGLDQLDDSSSETSGKNKTGSETFNNRVDEDAKKIVQDLNGAGSSTEAKEYIEKIFSSEASKDVKYKAQKISLRKLASLAEEEGRFEDAQQYLAVYVKRFPDDALIPLVLLNQGKLYRKMGAYDLERQKCYDVIKAAQGVELDRDKYNLNYVKRAVLTAQINIAESFFDEAKKMPTKLAEMGFSNSVEQFQRLTNSVELLNQGSEFDGLKLGELNNEDLSLKLIRALHELSISKRSKLSISKRSNNQSIDADKQELIKSFESVHIEGDRFIKNYEAAATDKKGEVLYYVLHAIRNSNVDPSKISSELLKEFEDLYKLRSENDVKTLPWILKGADELGQYFFLKGKYEKGKYEKEESYENARRVFEMHVELIAGTKGESGKLLEMLYGLQYAGTLIDRKIEQKSLYSDTFNDVRGIVNDVKSGAEMIGLKLPLLSNLSLIGVDEDGDGMDAYDELLTGHSDTNTDNVPSQSEVDEKVKLKGVGNDAGGKDANEEIWSVTSDAAPEVFSENEKLKNIVAQSIKYLKSQANIRYRNILPVLYNLGLCYENLSEKDKALTVFKMIPAAVVKVNPLNGEFVDDAIFESRDEPLQFQVVKLLDNTLYPGAALVCHRGGEIKVGDVFRSKDENELEIEHFLSLDSLLSQKHVGDGSLSLRLIRDMAVWRVNNLSWLSEFKDGVNDVN